MSKLNVKIMKKIILMSSVIGLLVLGINYTFFCPTIINEFIATKVYSEPSNSYFDDENFYKCVVDAYNKENKTSLPYTTSLSNEQLRTITSLLCYNKSITSAKGLEKMTSLTSLYIHWNKLTELDISKNTSLTNLDASKNQLTNLDVSNNILLDKLAIDGNNINELDVSNNINLTFLNANSNNLDNIDVSRNIQLVTLEVGKNNLQTIDITSNKNLQRLNIGNNTISNVDISNNTNLTFLNAVSNNIDQINLLNNKKLQKIYLGINELTTIDLSNNKELIFLDLGNADSYLSGSHGTVSGGHSNTCGNNIKELNLSQNTKLETLNAPNNQLSTLDLSNNTELQSLNLRNNKLTNINLSKNNKLKSLPSGMVDTSGLSYNNLKTIVFIDNNYLDITLIKTIISNDAPIEHIEIGDKSITVTADLKYYLHNKIVVGENITAQDLIKRLNLVGLTAKVFNSEVEIINEQVENDYVLKIYNEDEEIDSVVIRKLVNSKFNDANFYQCVIDGYNKINKTNLTILDELEVPQLQTIEKVSCEKANEKIYNKITDITGIEYLTGLKSLDLSYNENLNNIDLSNQKKLETLRLDKTSIYEIDVSDMLNLSTLSLRYNEITDINLNSNIDLSSLSLDNNKLEVLDISNNTNLTFLSAINNKLKYIDAINNEKLQILQLHDNQLTNMNLSKNIALRSLGVNNNQLTDLDVSQNTSLTTLYAYSNPYNKNIVSYLNAAIDLIESSSLKLPDDKIVTIGSITNYSNRLDGGNISFNELGKYIFTSNYNHNIQTSGNIFSVDYTVYVIEANSDKYIINNEDSYIYTGLDTDNDTILKNINISYGKNTNYEDIVVTKEIVDNQLVLKYEDETIKTFDLVNISSNEYDLTKEYIYIGADNLDLDNINVTNGTKMITDNKLQIKYGSDVLKEFKLVSISSDKYDLSKDYIYTNTSTFDIEKVNVINSTKITANNKLQIKYGNNVILKEYKLLSISFGELKSFEKSITILEDITYEDFVRNITVSDGLAYKIFKESVEVTTGNIEKDMILKVYYNNVEIDMFTITDEYLNIDESIKVDEVGKYFSNIDFNTSADSILSKIDTTGEVTIKNNKNEVITGTNLVGTGSTVTIKLSKETYNYTIIINGDIDGDGILKLSDIMKIANYTYKDKNSLSGAYVKAADFDNNGSINLSDIMKSAKALYGGN